MLRSVLAWTLLAAFLVTVPVTGGGQCPCRFVNALRTPATPPAGQATAPPQAGKGCCPRCHFDAPDQGGGDRKTPAPGRPADAPCDHNMVVDAAPAGAADERSGAECGGWDAGAVAGSDQPHSHATPDPITAPGGPPPVRPTDRHFLRYAHAFRC